MTFGGSRGNKKPPTRLKGFLPAVAVALRRHIYMNMYTHTHIYIYIYTQIHQKEHRPGYLLSAVAVAARNSPQISKVACRR